jgi:asparagine synthase (glutamine-hydrolysing)
MCGFAAIFAHADAAPPVDAGQLLRVRDTMRARGPDGAAHWLSSDCRVGLAHRRLAIIDLSPAGEQPMATADGRFRIVFNGEIYNYRELRAELEAAGAVFRSHTDTEVILELYRRHGRAMLGRLRGMFALALWDEAAQGLLLARDPFGIKPLYLADDGKVLRAASQVKALLAGDGIDTSPDAAGHAGFFLWGHVPEPHTLYRGIRALPAGSWLWRDRGGDRAEGRFFDFHAELVAARAEPGAADTVRAALLDSVRHHLEADVPVGVFLSGGLDSTTLVALAAEAASTTLATLTLGFAEFAGTARDEVPLAEAVARAYATDHHTARIDAADFVASRDAILHAMDQPSVDGVNTWLVARAASERGLKVVLSGLGGDELFGGYDSFRQIPRLVKALGLSRLVPGLGTFARRTTARWIGRFTHPKAAGLLEYGSRISDAYLLRRGLFMPWELPEVMDPDMARAGWHALAARAELAETTACIASDRLAVSALETAWYMRNQLLRDCDWAGMAHSLEVRVPLVDSTLFRALLPLNAGPVPPSKRDMAAAARPCLPDAVLNRPKTGFSVPIAEWLGETSLRGWAKTIYSRFTSK